MSPGEGSVFHREGTACKTADSYQKWKFSEKLKISGSKTNYHPNLHLSKCTQNWKAKNQQSSVALAYFSLPSTCHSPKRHLKYIYLAAYSLTPSSLSPHPAASELIIYTEDRRISIKCHIGHGNPLWILQ